MKVCHLRLMPCAHLVEEITQRRGSEGICCNTRGQGSCPVYLQSSIESVRSRPFGSESYLDGIDLQDGSQSDSVNESIP